MKHDDLVGHGHGFDLVMRHIDRGRADALMHGLDLAAHLHAQLGVEVGERLVEEEDLRIAHQGSADGNTLALTAGELARVAIQQLLQSKNAGGLVYLRLRHGGIDLLELQGKAHILGDCHMRIECVVLKDHGDIAVTGRQVADLARADMDFAVAQLFEACDHAKQGGFAAAGWTDQHDEFSVTNIDIDTVDDIDRAEALLDILDIDGCHDDYPVIKAIAAIGRISRP